MQQYLSLIKIP